MPDLNCVTSAPSSSSTINGKTESEIGAEKQRTETATANSRRKNPQLQRENHVSSIEMPLADPAVQNFLINHRPAKPIYDIRAEYIPNCSQELLNKRAQRSASDLDVARNTRPKIASYQFAKTPPSVPSERSAFVRYQRNSKRRHSGFNGVTFSDSENVIGCEGGKEYFQRIRARQSDLTSSSSESEIDSPPIGRSDPSGQRLTQQSESGEQLFDPVTRTNTRYNADICNFQLAKSKSIARDFSKPRELQEVTLNLDYAPTDSPKMYSKQNRPERTASNSATIATETTEQLSTIIYIGGTAPTAKSDNGLSKMGSSFPRAGLTDQNSATKNAEGKNEPLTPRAPERRRLDRSVSSSAVTTNIQWRCKNLDDVELSETKLDKKLSQLMNSEDVGPNRAAKLDDIGRSTSDSVNSITEFVAARPLFHREPDTLVYRQTCVPLDPSASLPSLAPKRQTRQDHSKFSTFKRIFRVNRSASLSNFGVLRQKLPFKSSKQRHDFSRERNHVPDGESTEPATLVFHSIHESCAAINEANRSVLISDSVEVPPIIPRPAFTENGSVKQNGHANGVLKTSLPKKQPNSVLKRHSSSSQLVQPIREVDGEAEEESAGPVSVSAGPTPCSVRRIKVLDQEPDFNQYSVSDDWLDQGSSALDSQSSTESGSTPDRRLSAEERYETLTLMQLNTLAYIAENFPNPKAVWASQLGREVDLSQIRWRNLTILSNSPLLVTECATFYPAIYREPGPKALQPIKVTLMICGAKYWMPMPPSYSRPSTFFLPTLTEFTDRIPSKYLKLTYIDNDSGSECQTVEEQMINCGVVVTPRLLVATLETWADQTISRHQMMKQPSLHEKEVCFILIQLLSALKYLQQQGIEEAPLDLEGFLLVRHNLSRMPQLCLVWQSFAKLSSSQRIGKSANSRYGAPSTIGLCQCALVAIYILLHTEVPVSEILTASTVPTLKKVSPITGGFAKVAQILRQEKTDSLTQAQRLLEFMFWASGQLGRNSADQAPPDLAEVKSWLENQRAKKVGTFVKRMLQDKSQADVLEEFHIHFLLHASPKHLLTAYETLEQPEIFL